LFETTKSNRRAQYFIWKASVAPALGFDNHGVKSLATLLV
jgi:hypothetical protein